MKTKNVQKLKQIANQIRQDIIEMLYRAGSGHPAGALGMADIFAVLYFSVLSHTPERPDNPNRDRVVLSNGHICPVLYATLARAGYFPLVKLKTLRKINSDLQGHPHNLDLPGVETSSGPLGQGISQAVGMALAGKMDKAWHHIYCLTSDGEHNEGQLWEAVMTANKYKLNNLTVIVDYNRIQIDGFTKDIMPLASLRNKYLAFGWEVKEVGGNNIRELLRVLPLRKNKPLVIIAHTTPGQGVSFMEDKWQWHGQAPDKDQTAEALAELKTKI
ncbi:MAG: transketolase [Parcubacteria group bacterium]|nr:MAG: transketolase [Parcubacteria group bacterium]